MARGPDDGAPLRRLRWWATLVFIVLSAVLVVAYVLGRPVGEAYSGLVFGTLLALLGLSSIERVLDHKGDDD